MSSDLAVVVSAARVLIAAGDEKRALTVAEQLGARLEPDPQMYAGLLRGEAAIERRSYRDAIARLKEARKLADSWLVRYALGRAYLEAGSFAEADAEFDACVKRRGEAAAVYLDEVPTFHVFPPVYYYLAGCVKASRARARPTPSRRSWDSRRARAARCRRRAPAARRQKKRRRTARARRRLSLARNGGDRRPTGASRSSLASGCRR
jgi:tetratricopeptide (TPR) repeat protein